MIGYLYILTRVSQNLPPQYLYVMIFPPFSLNSCLIHLDLLCIIDQPCHLSAGEDVKVDESLFQDLEDLDLEDEDLAELSDS